MFRGRLCETARSQATQRERDIYIYICTHTHTLPTPYREVEWEKASVCCAFAQLTPRKWLALVAFDQVFCSLATVLFENNALEKEHVGPEARYRPRTPKW